MLRFLCLLVCLLATSSTVRGQTLPAKLPQVDNQVYVYKHSGGKPREIEVYFPPNHNPAQTPVPGMILFHGGAWTGGNRTQFTRACEYFASRGLVTATVSYRMLDKTEAAQLPAGETRKRVCITDAKSAIRWFKHHAKELGVDPARIITGGGSAGGHISVLATINPGLNDPQAPTGIDTSVIAYVLFNPAFTDTDKSDSEVDIRHHLKPHFAPAVVFFGTNDTWKPGWDAAAKQMQTSGIKNVQVQLAAGQPHGFFNKEPWQTVTLISTDRFLVQQGLLSGSPTLAPPLTGERLDAASPP